MLSRRIKVDERYAVRVGKRVYEGVVNGFAQKGSEVSWNVQYINVKGDKVSSWVRPNMVIAPWGEYQEQEAKAKAAARYQERLLQAHILRANASKEHAEAVRKRVEEEMRRDLVIIQRPTNMALISSLDEDEIGWFRTGSDGIQREMARELLMAARRRAIAMGAELARQTASAAYLTDHPVEDYLEPEEPEDEPEVLEPEVLAEESPEGLVAAPELSEDVEAVQTPPKRPKRSTRPKPRARQVPGSRGAGAEASDAEVDEVDEVDLVRELA